MLFSTSLLVGVSALASVAAAQTLAFTSTFTSVTAGVPIKITWQGGNTNQAVEIDLRQGPTNNLGPPKVITTSGTGGSFLWTPSLSLSNANNYAIEIQQSGSAINFWGPFSVTGGTGASSTTSSTSASANVTSAVSSTASVTSSSLNQTNATTTLAGTAVSSGTGIPLSRNTTFSSATLSTTATSLTTSAVTTTPVVSAPAPTKSSGASQGLSSSLAFVLTAVAAMICFQ